MRQTIVWSIVGALVVFALAEATLAIAEPALPQPVEWYSSTAHAKVTQMERIARQRRHVDVAFVGPSTVFRALDVKAFERADPRDRDAYNAGLSGAYPPVMRRWIFEEVVPRLDPDTVVYGLSSLDFHDRIFRGSRDAYRTARATRRGLLANAERLAARYSRLFRYRPLLGDPGHYSYLQKVARGRTEGQLEREMRTLSPDGFRPKQPLDLDDRRSVVRAILRGFDIGREGMRNVTAIVEGLQARGVRVVLVNMPVPDRFVALHPGGSVDYARFERTLEALAASLDVELLQPPDELRHESLYADHVHHNHEGARRFSRWIATALSH